MDDLSLLKNKFPFEVDTTHCLGYPNHIESDHIGLDWFILCVVGFLQPDAGPPGPRRPGGHHLRSLYRLQQGTQRCQVIVIPKY